MLTVSVFGSDDRPMPEDLLYRDAYTKLDFVPYAVRESFFTPEDNVDGLDSTDNENCWAPKAGLYLAPGIQVKKICRGADVLFTATRHAVTFCSQNLALDLGIPVRIKDGNAPLLIKKIGRAYYVVVWKRGKFRLKSHAYDGYAAAAAEFRTILRTREKS